MGTISLRCLWLPALFSLGCTGDPLEVCDACMSSLEDAEVVPDAGKDDAAVRSCTPGPGPLSRLQLFGESSDGWNEVATSTAVFVSTGAGSGRVSVGEVDFQVSSAHPRFSELAGPVRVTFLRRNGALIVFGWAASIESLRSGGLVVVGWSSWEEQTLQTVLGRLGQPPRLRYLPQGCLLPDSCGDREALSLSVDLGDGPIDVPHRTTMPVGEAELTNGASRAAPLETRCTEQSAFYEGSLIFVAD